MQSHWLLRRRSRSLEQRNNNSHENEARRQEREKRRETPKRRSTPPERQHQKGENERRVTHIACDTTLQDAAQHNRRHFVTLSRMIVVLLVRSRFVNAEFFPRANAIALAPSTPMLLPRTTQRQCARKRSATTRRKESAGNTETTKQNARQPASEKSE